MTLLKELRTIALGIACCLALATAFAQTPHRIFPLDAIGPDIAALAAADVDTDFTATVATPFNCGRVSSPTYCYGLPITINGQPAGTLWLDTYLTGTNAGSGFIVWYGVADLAEAHVTGVNPIGGTSMPSQLTVSFAGDTNDGGGSYVGSMTLDFSYYFSKGGGGRGGAGSGYRYICTGGTVAIHYQ